MLINRPRYYPFFIFILLTHFVHAQNAASGKITDAKTNKEISGVDVFINESNKPTITTTSGNFMVQSDSIIYKLKFLRKNYSLETVDVTPENATNIFVKLSQEKVSNIEEVVIHNEKPKYKNKRENPAYALGVQNEVLPQRFIREIPASTSDYWKMKIRKIYWI
jgi:hypothetical protein